MPELKYRPNHFDDWGFIRNADGSLHAVVRRPEAFDGEFDQCRSAGTDPFADLAQKIIFASVSMPVELNVILPLNRSPTDIGVILDADGQDVCTVDSEGRRDDREVEEIAGWIICAVNSCGGFKAEVYKDG